MRYIVQYRPAIFLAEWQNLNGKRLRSIQKDAKKIAGRMKL
jgi:hypothetical protein